MRKIKYIGGHAIKVDRIGDWQPNEVKEIEKDWLANQLISKNKFIEIRVEKKKVDVETSYNIDYITSKKEV